MREAMDGGQLRRREVPAAIWKGGGSSPSGSEEIWKGGGSEEMDGLVWWWERKEAGGGWKMTS